MTGHEFFPGSKFDGPTYVTVTETITVQGSINLGFKSPALANYSPSYNNSQGLAFASFPTSEDAELGVSISGTSTISWSNANYLQSIFHAGVIGYSYFVAGTDSTAIGLTVGLYIRNEEAGITLAAPSLITIVGA